MHSGRKSSITDTCVALLFKWLVQSKENGLSVNDEMMQSKLGELDDSFCQETPNAIKLIIRRLAKRHKVLALK